MYAMNYDSTPVFYTQIRDTYENVRPLVPRMHSHNDTYVESDKYMSSSSYAMIQVSSCSRYTYIRQA